MAYRVLSGILTEDQEADIIRRYGANGVKAPPVVAAPSTPPVAKTKPKPKPKPASPTPAATAKRGARFGWRYFASRDDLNTIVVTGDEKPNPGLVAMFERRRGSYGKAMAALERIGLSPNAFAIYHRDYLSDDPTGIYIAPKGEASWPKVGEFYKADVNYRAIGWGRFDGSETAEQLAMFACRLWEDGEWFAFVPETFDGLTQEEIDTINLSSFSKARVRFPESRFGV